MNVMRSISFLVVAVFAATGAWAQNRYLVIYKSNQGFAAMNSFMSLEASKGWGLKKTLPTVRGMILQNSNILAIEKLKSHPEVLLVEKEVFHPLPKPMHKFLLRTKKSSVPTVIGPGDPAAFQVGEATSWGITTVKAPEAWKTSTDAGAQARIVIIDTGVDKNHVALSANFEKGRNFTKEDPALISDDVTDEAGHGTHTSGTAAAYYNQATGFSGVAPKSKFLMAKVCVPEVCTDPMDQNTCTGGCSSVGIAMAIDWAIQEKADVISISLGASEATAGEELSYNSAESAGIFVAAASGNEAEVQLDGSIVTPGVNYPGALPHVFAVGAVDKASVKADFSNWGPELAISAPGVGILSSIPMGSGREASLELAINGQKIHVESSLITGATELTHAASGAIVFAGFGETTDFASTNIRGKIALISRGSINFLDKVKNAMAAGAAGAIIFNNTMGEIYGTLGDGVAFDFPAVTISYLDGQKILNQLKLRTVIEAEVNVLVRDYEAWDGTSMATPHVAGIAALVISAYKNSHAGKTLTPAALRTILKNTAVKLSPNLNNEYGAGLIQADAAVAAAIAAP